MLVVGSDHGPSEPRSEQQLDSLATTRTPAGHRPPGSRRRAVICPASSLAEFPGEPGLNGVVRWSVGIQAEADRTLSREEVVELADAVAAYDGIATGIGSSRYGAQLVVRADSREEAIEKATARFTSAVEQARLPDGPIVRTEAISEEEDEDIDVGRPE